MVIEFAPVARLEPLTVRLADAEDPELFKATLPSVTPDVTNMTVPVGAVLPEGGLTRAVSTVDPVRATLVGLAVTVVVEAETTGLTVMLTGAETDVENPVVPM